MQKNATQSTVVRVNNKRKYAHQMRANARKRVFEHAFFNTRLRKSRACVLRVRWPLISDLYCTYHILSSVYLYNVVNIGLGTCSSGTGD